MTVRTRLSISLLLVFCAGLVAGAVFAEPVFLDETAAGLYELEGESVLQLQGFSGRVSFRIGEAGQLRFMATDLKDRNTERPVELWKDGRTLILRPAEGFDGEPFRLEGALPPGMSIDATLNDTDLLFGNIEGDVQVVGERLDLRLATINGNVSIDLKESKMRADNIAGDIEVEGKSLQAVIQSVGGMFTGEFESGRFDAAQLKGMVEIDADDTVATLRTVLMPVRVTMTGGSLGTDGINGGGVFRLDGTALTLRNCAGDIRVETDAAISFESCKADLHFDAYGASLRGVGNEGILEIKTENAEIILEDLKGASRIQGDRLTVEIRKAAGEVLVLATASSVTIDNSNSPVTVENDFGDIHILNVTKKVDVTSRDGNVIIEHQLGPVSINAEGEQVVVGFSGLNWSENSRVVNHSGDIIVSLPAKGGLRIDGASSYGRIDSDLPDLQPSQDGRTIIGNLNRGGKMTLRLRAEGELTLRSGSGR